MRYLLDTHVLLWLASNDRKASKALRAELSAASERYVSAASAFEIATKARLGKLTGGLSVLDGWSLLLRNLQATELSLTVPQMSRAGALDWEHRDPFDRMLVAQSQLEALVLITDDATIRAFEDVRTSWPS